MGLAPLPFFPVIVRYSLGGNGIGLVLELLLNCMYVAHVATFTKPGVHLPKHCLPPLIP